MHFFVKVLIKVEVEDILLKRLLCLNMVVDSLYKAFLYNHNV